MDEHSKDIETSIETCGDLMWFGDPPFQETSICPMKTSQAFPGEIQMNRQPPMIFRRVAASTFVHHQKRSKNNLPQRPQRDAKGKFIIPIPSAMIGAASTHFHTFTNPLNWKLILRITLLDSAWFRKLELCHAICFAHTVVHQTLNVVVPCCPTFNIFLHLFAIFPRRIWCWSSKRRGLGVLFSLGWTHQ